MNNENEPKGRLESALRLRVPVVSVFANGVLASAGVQKLLFDHWSLVAPIAEGSTLGMVAVASVATLVGFAWSVLLCWEKDVFLKVTAALESLLPERWRKTLSRPVFGTRKPDMESEPSLKEPRDDPEVGTDGKQATT